MKLEIRTSPNTGAELDIHFLPNVTRYEDGMKKVMVVVYSSNHDNSILHKLPWGFEYDVTDKSLQPTVMFTTGETMVTQETMENVLSGYFGGSYEIVLDPVSYSGFLPHSYDPEVKPLGTVFFEVRRKSD
ncbi:hypothetical protein NELLIE_54 [Arthrobacter phage Nellie]|uniref:Uncharacterized protein n=3 Tax=Jasminevirus adat TaxID=2560299 RepID=A0A249XN96_9CAUD|nr:hypothetical protein FDI47_gp54 [Arthrobacter phage Adat]ASZ72625.1 hypothetical protein ADAT_54 [Arthrobacter phage Adat]ASZ73207.1 hypothetical protein GURGLEFERB_54 [Arthrobacter phage GurgleFerb]ASZ73772.1 hypothetical protein NELLIE_54 [Arthrobacter phage Nellie]